MKTKFELKEDQIRYTQINTYSFTLTYGGIIFDVEYQIIFCKNEGEEWERDIFEVVDCTRIVFLEKEITEVKEITQFFNSLKETGVDFWEIISKESEPFLERISRQYLDKLNKI